MTITTTYANLNALLQDIQQQVKSPAWALFNRGRVETIYKENFAVIVKMHSGMQEIALKYCKMENEAPVITEGKMAFDTPEREAAFNEELGKFMGTTFKLVY